MEREVTQSSTRSILSEKEKPVQVEGGKEEKFAMADKVNSTAGKNIIEDPFNEKPITCEEVKTAALVDEDHKIDESHFEDDGEDLPDNFFDDFSNQDFMAGLDIVDDWIDDGEEIERQPVESLKQKTKDPKYEKSVHKSSRDKSRYDDYDRSRYDRSRRRYSRDDGRYFKEIHRRRSRSPHRRSHSAHKRSRSRNRRSRSRNRQSRSKHGTDKHHAGEKKECDEERNSEGHGDQRRDPEKTKRDIQRDKVRCAKDIEARVFQEQIRVAETGLVPPGTELDVVLEKEKLREEAEKEKERNKENKRDIEVKEDENKKERPAEKRRPSSRSRSDRKPIRIDGSKPYSPTRDTSINRDDNVEKYKEGPAGHRRDPEKTKHDIQRDKVRCAKDVEIRVFQEQIKVAETGLVPPGTELDVVLEKEKLKEEVTKQKESKPSSGLKESESRKDKKNEDREKRKTSPRPRPDRRRYRSPIKLSHLRDRSRSRSFSPKRRRRNSHSYERERRLRSRSRRRDSREIDLRYRLREKREKYFNELSPVSDKRMSRSPSMFNISPQSLISDRESWLRDRERMDRYGRTRHSRSCSPVSSSSFTERDRGGSPRRRTKKFSFMEELEIKLKNSRVKPPPSLLVTVPNEGAYAPHPTMVPHPHDFAPQGQMNMPFQPNPPMFMGPAPSMCPPPDPNHMHMGPSISDPNMIPPLMNIHVNAPPMMDMLPQPMMSNMAPGMPLGMPGGVPQGVPPPAMVPFPGGPGPCPVPCPVPPVQTPQGMYFDPNQYNPAQFRMDSNVAESHAEGNKELAKLFEDKKISLSDFLSVAAKPIGPSTPVSIHNKIRVISRCQEALKLLEETTLTGRFFPKTSAQVLEAEKRASEKASVNQSPLRKVVVVRFNFTTPVNKRAHNKLMNHPAPGVYLYKVLSMLGMPKEEKLSPVPKPEESPKAPVPVPVPPPAPVIKKIHMVVQTDPWKCKICEIRNSRKFSTESTQTVEKSMLDAGTQVSVEDLNKSCATFTPRGILKNSTSSVQSISHLTPAQLLAQQEKERKEETSSKSWASKETFPVSRSSFGDHPPSQYNPRPISASNDRFSDSFRNTPFIDNYLAGDRDRFSGNFGSSDNIRNDPFTNRDFMNRASNFGSQINDPRDFDGSYNSNWRLSDMNPNYGNWNSSMSSGMNRFMSPMSGNNRFNPRGPY